MRLVAATIVSLAVTVAAEAGAGPEGQESAKFHFDEGVRLYKQDDFSGALAEFLKAYEAKKHFSVLYNIASCQMELEMYLDARDNFKLYLEEGWTSVDAERIEEVERKLARIEELLCKVQIDVDEDGATVLINGKQVGTTPLDSIIFLDAGTHVLTIEKQGFRKHTGEFILSRSEKASFSVSLEPEKTAKQRRKAPVAAFIALAGAGGAALVASAVTGGLTISKNRRFEDLYYEDDWRPLKKDVESLALATDVLWISGAALVVTALVLIPFTDFPRKERTVGLSPLLGPGVAGLSLEGGF
jgi:hypothetical protein